jgi:hypothetical protein
LPCTARTSRASARSGRSRSLVADEVHDPVGVLREPLAVGEPAVQLGPSLGRDRSGFGRDRRELGGADLAGPDGGAQVGHGAQQLAVALQPAAVAVGRSGRQGEQGVEGQRGGPFGEAVGQCVVGQLDRRGVTEVERTQQVDQGTQLPTCDGTVGGGGEHPVHLGAKRTDLVPQRRSGVASCGRVTCVVSAVQAEVGAAVVVLAPALAVTVVAVVVVAGVFADDRDDRPAVPVGGGGGRVAGHRRSV